MLADLAEIDETITEIRANCGLAAWETKREEVKEKIDVLVIENNLEFENDEIRIVRVQGFRRKWNVDKLESIMPRPLFRRVIKVEVDAVKLDQLVKEGKIDSKKLDPAFEETPNKAYAKWTPKGKNTGGAEEAASLAEKLA